jgi:hypothetical protein
MQATNDKTTQALKNAMRYYDLALAIIAMNHCVKAHFIMLGDDGRFWVVTPADASRLERAGYEYAL